MTSSAGIRGNEGLFLTAKLGAGSAIDFSGDVKSFVLDSADPDDSDLTFADAAAGGAEIDTVTLTAIQSTDAASLWRFCWDNPSAVVAVEFGPHGNAVASVAQPHFTFSVTLGTRPKIGGDAKRDKTRQDFDATWTLTAAPVLKTT